MNVEHCINFCKKEWSEGGHTLEGLKEFVRVPNLSTEYDPEYFTNGLVNKAIEVVRKWMKDTGVNGLECKLFDEKGREPLLMVTVPGSSKTSKHVLAYGHLDKMPHCDPNLWDKGLSATNPVIRDGKIYGRGTNDDGYNPFCIINSMKYLQQNKLPYPKLTMILETGEESGDEGITKYLKELAPTIGKVDVILVLDAEAEDYKTVWICSSLRGVVIGKLEIAHLSQPCHSGMATGLVPSTFRIARMLLSRIEDEVTGEIKIKSAHLPEIPKEKIEENYACAKHLGKDAVAIVTLLDGCKHLTDDIGQLLVNKGWRPGLCVTGADGIPSIADAGNVMRTKTVLKLSLRIPPWVNPEEVGKAMKAELERDPPYGAKVSFDVAATGSGWAGKGFNKNIKDALHNNVKKVFGQEPLSYGDGGSIPLCNLLQELWPDSSLIVSGAAGLDSCPHGPNESLNLGYTALFNAAFTGFLSDINK